MKMQLKGIYPIVPTPFSDSGAVDVDSIDKVTSFMVKRGVDGLAVLGALGEGHKLDDSERTQVIERFGAALPDGLGLVVGVRAAATDLAVRMAQHASRLGADGLLLGPLTVQNDNALRTYYQRVSDAVDVPVIIHDFPAATGITMTPELIADIFRTCSNVQYVKLEDPPTGPKMDAVWALTGKDLGIFGALGGMFAFEELDRGAVGIMTGFAYPELLVELYRRNSSGDTDGAAQLFYDILPLIRLEFQPGIGVSLRKNILVRRGVFQS
ncbi:MAG: dihydrodipicolinate synthase family protein, partial [Gemmatimonadales bacterium]|nr:dihydrodipicolinate synthase family protein [Gemmatimonadales bacterium]